MDGQNFCLKWDAYQSSVTAVFDRLRQDEELVDITLCCEGQSVRAHRVVLSACSPYFRELLRNNPCQQMVFFLKDTSAADLYGIVEFMYKGSVNVAQSQLASFLKTAEMLQIRGLSSDENKTSTRAPERRASPSSPPARKRARHSPSSVVSPVRNRSCSTEPSYKREDSAEEEDIAVPESPRREDRAVSGRLSVDSGGVSANRSRRPETSVGGSTNSSLALTTDRGQHQSAVPDSFPISSLSRPMSSFSSAQVDEFRRRSGNIKTEKQEVDLTSEEDASLDATLGLVTDFENHSNGAYAESIGTTGGDRSRGSHNVLPYSAGPSHRLGDDASDKGKKKYSCDICGKTYGYRDSVYRHKRTHEGKTACFVCGKILSCLPTLREHLRFQHNLSQEEVACLVSAAPRPAGLAAAAAAATASALAGVLTDSTGGTLDVESGCVAEVASNTQGR